MACIGVALFDPRAPSGFQGDFPDKITKTAKSSGFQGDFPDKITKTYKSSGFQGDFPDEIKGKPTTGRQRQGEEVRSRMARIKKLRAR